MGLQNYTERDYYEGGDYGGYQFISLDNLVNNFIIAYVGEGKTISKIKRTDVAFHAQRAMQELSYDTLRSEKSQEIEISPALTMPLPHDYVNYVKLSWVDSTGIERIIYPATKTSNPRAILQDSSYDYLYNSDSLLYASDSNTWDKYKTTGPGNSSNNAVTSEDQDGAFNLAYGQRYGIDPQFAQSNGTFFIDPVKSTIYFSSDMADRTVTLKYISDGVALDSEMLVHKFAEEAIYKHIAYSIVSARSNMPEYLVARYKREKFAAARQAKLRLSNIKLEEISQVLRGKSKHIKH
jgi:translation elongation factor P/translation initiation factor 5A